jgi:hypothetical protein
MPLDIAAGPLLALVIGITSLFYEKQSSERKYFFYVLLVALFLTFVIETRTKSEDKQEAKDQKKWSDARITELSEALSSFEKNTQRSLDQIIGLLPAKLAATVKEPITAKSVQKDESGFAYYGIQNFDGTWSARYFKKAAGDPNESPHVGDTVVAVSNVNARAGYIEYGSGKGWVNKPVTGAIKPNDRLKVLEVNPIAGSFIWIKFKRVS